MSVGEQAIPGVAHGFYILFGKTSYGNSAWNKQDEDYYIMTRVIKKQTLLSVHQEVW